MRDEISQFDSFEAVCDVGLLLEHLEELGKFLAAFQGHRLEPPAREKEGEGTIHASKTLMEVLLGGEVGARR